MGETRVNLKHLLEDMRDGYPIALEEAILTELIANSLDSGASEIWFQMDARASSFMVIDCGTGMSKEDLAKYHDIATTTKEKGKGIGFAGLGAKLALLLAREVQTETKSKDSHYATRWYLESDLKAPWDFIDPPGLVTTKTGTAVKVFFNNSANDLLNSRFLTGTIQKWFCPLLEKDFMAKILKEVYPRGVNFYVNGKKVDLPQKPTFLNFLGRNRPKPFVVRLGKRGKPVGVGFLRKSSQDLPEDDRGLAISVYGKVIKRGWEWIGISPKDQKRIWGMVEVPQLSSILTTSKCDFLQDAASKQKYYQYRKAIAIATEPILHSLGELPEVERRVAPLALEKEIQRVLEKIMPDFPELEPLMGRRGRGEKVASVEPDPEASPAGILREGVGVVTGDKGGPGQGGGINMGPGLGPGERIDPDTPPIEPGTEHQRRRRPPGLMPGYEDRPDRDELGWLEGTRVLINSGHPAFKKIENQARLENYHSLLTIAWVLSNNLAQDKSPQGFINSFLRVWGSARER